MPGLRLGIDLDGVVADFTKGWMNFYNQEFGTELKVEDSVSWNGLTELTHFKSMGEFWRWASDLDGRSIFWHLDTFPGAVEALHDLASEGHHIAILTTKPEFAVHDTFEWLAKHELPTTEVHILEDKWRVDCDVYLDDSPIVLPRLILHRGDRTVCRFVRPWNSPVDGAIDVEGFADFQQVVSGLA
ncbi:MAG: hypothetical protein DWQ40_03025 [Actinobacteria bacterium]|nr:MAG: hypothetical protein DWQ40_03025 [Actinomycetota bacterium]REK34026.1 MAG: hypothetical protein DWQ20_07145 [Actinomycetota bacterium]